MDDGSTPPEGLVERPKQPKKKIRCKSLADPMDGPWVGEHNLNLRRFENLLEDVKEEEDHDTKFTLSSPTHKARRSYSHKDSRSLLHPDRRRESGSQIHFFRPRRAYPLVRYDGVRNFSKQYPELAQYRTSMPQVSVPSLKDRHAVAAATSMPAASSEANTSETPMRLSLRSLLAGSPQFLRFSTDRQRSGSVVLGEECHGARLLCDNPRPDENLEFVRDFHPVILEPSFGWQVEPPGLDDAASESPWEVDFLQFESDYYIAEFYQKEHYNFFATEKILGHVIGSIRKDKPAQIVRVLLRTKKTTVKFEVPFSHARKVSMKVLLRDLAWNEGRIPAWNLQNIRSVQHPDLQDELVRYERADIFKKYKFGVLLVRQGQTRDDEFFSNVEGSEEYEEFLSVLGDRIELHGWKQYAGGLDVVTHATGQHSIYRLYYSLESRYEIMFHVSTLLPFQPSDTQHVERKRHLGNDVVNIIYNESDEPFTPASIVTNFIHCYIVISLDKAATQREDSPHYRVEIVTQNQVPVFGPPLKDPPIFSKQELRSWLPSKLINAERASFMAPAIRQKLTNTRRQILADIATRFG